MKRLLASLVITVLLLCSLTSCLYPNLSILGQKEEDSSSENASGVDIAALANETVPQALRANVKVSVAFGTFIATSTSQGSGVVLDLGSDEYFYALTNYHVVTDDNGRTGSCRVVNAYGDTYSATLLALDADCDLALLRFNKAEDTPILTATLADTNASRGSLLFSVSNPQGLNNSVSYGTLLEYTDLESDGIDLAVGAHDAPIDSGSSGGGVYNTDGELIGITFAGGENTVSGETYSFFIPIERVREFLADNGFAASL